MHEADLYLRWEKCLGGWQMGGCVPILCAGSQERGTTAAGAPFYATGYCKSNVTTTTSILVIQEVFYVVWYLFFIPLYM